MKRKRKINAPVIVDADQHIAPGEATALLQDWCYLKQSTASTERKTISKRVARWRKGHDLKSLTVSDVCDIAEHHNIQIPTGTPRNAEASLVGMQMEMKTTNPSAYTSQQEILKDLKQCKALVSQLEEEIRPLREDAERRRKAGSRHNHDQ